MRQCEICYEEYTNPKKHQKTCLKPECQDELHRRNVIKWRERNKKKYKKYYYKDIADPIFIKNMAEKKVTCICRIGKHTFEGYKGQQLCDTHREPYYKTMSGRMDETTLPVFSTF